MKVLQNPENLTTDTGVLYLSCWVSMRAVNHLQPLVSEKSQLSNCEQYFYNRKRVLVSNSKCYTLNLYSYFIGISVKIKLRLY